MKAITLHQPWATLIAKGIKTTETRSWAPPQELVGERIAIHAGRTVSEIGLVGPDRAPLMWDSRKLPRGAVVATAILTDFGQVTHRTPDGEQVYLSHNHGWVNTDPWGDYSVARWIWCLSDIEELDPPIPARGHQRIWEWVQ